MSKTLISVIVVAVVIIGGYFLITAKKGDNATPVVSTETNTNGQQDAGKKMAFSEFVKQGGTYKCDVKQNMSDMENSGTVYISGSNLRGEFSTIAEGRTMDTSFIMRDGYSYTWSSALPNMGFKTKIATGAANTDGSASGTYSWNAEQIGDYNCEAWTADESKFTLPANITFKEIVGK